MPMVLEAVVAAYAIAKVGAIYLPIFSGFAPSAIASRLQDAEAKVVLTADGTWRRGKHGAMKPVCDEAVAMCPTVRRVVVLDRLGLDVPMTGGRDVGWSDYVAGHDATAAPHDTASEDVFMLAYTSGTTGKPKGAVHVHGGFLVKIASECAYQCDIHPGEVWYWVTDMGWIMGPLSMVGAHANGATMVMYEGAPDFPDPGRVWASVEQHGVNMLGISPTLIRALRTKGAEWVHEHDLSSLRILGSTGEPWNPEPYNWLVARGRRRAACRSSTSPAGRRSAPASCRRSRSSRSRSARWAASASGWTWTSSTPTATACAAEVGELVCKQPWPAMTRGVWKDPERFLSSYW